MDPISLTIAAIAYVGAEVAKKASDQAADDLWERIKGLWKRTFGTAPAPGTLTGSAVASLVADSEDLSRWAEGFVVERSAFRRLRVAGEVLKGATVLWVDDAPENNTWEVAMLEALGTRVRTAETSRSALALLGSAPFNLVISDVTREDNTAAGLEALPALKRAQNVPVVFYVTELDDSGVPAGAFGIANEPNELLHLVLDVLERRRL